MEREPRAFADGDEDGAARWTAETFAAWAASLSSTQRDAVEAYKATSSYRGLNARLRREDPTVLDTDLVVHLDAALSVFRLREPVVVWRGWQNAAVADAIAGGFDLTGGVFTDEAYVSTSLLRPMALRYLTAVDEPENAILARITLQAETHVGVYAGAPDLVFEKQEHEVLLPRETPMRITGVDVPPEDSDHVPTIHFEVDP